MYQKFLLWCKVLLKNQNGKYLQLWTKRSHERVDMMLDTMRWSLPWWRIEEWEDMESATVRELKEETWLDVSKDSLKFLWTIQTTIQLDMNKPWTVWKYGLFLNWYECLLQIDTTIIPSDEHESHRWVDKNVVRKEILKVAQYSNSLSFIY